MVVLPGHLTGDKLAPVVSGLEPHFAVGRFSLDGDRKPRVVLALQKAVLLPLLGWLGT